MLTLIFRFQNAGRLFRPSVFLRGDQLGRASEHSTSNASGYVPTHDTSLPAPSGWLPLGCVWQNHTLGMLDEMRILVPGRAHICLHSPSFTNLLHAGPAPAGTLPCMQEAGCGQPCKWLASCRRPSPSPSVMDRGSSAFSRCADCVVGRPEQGARAGLNAYAFRSRWPSPTFYLTLLSDTIPPAAISPCCPHSSSVPFYSRPGNFETLWR